MEPKYKLDQKVIYWGYYSPSIWAITKIHISKTRINYTAKEEEDSREENFREDEIFDNIEDALQQKINELRERENRLINDYSLAKAKLEGKPLQLKGGARYGR